MRSHIFFDRTKYHEINWSNIKWSTGENRKVTRSNINDQRKRKNKDEIKWALGWCVQQQMPRLQIVLQSFFGGAQKKLLSEESTFLLPKVIKYQRIRTIHNKGYLHVFIYKLKIELLILSPMVWSRPSLGVLHKFRGTYWQF